MADMTPEQLMEGARSIIDQMPPQSGMGQQLAQAMDSLPPQLQPQPIPAALSTGIDPRFPGQIVLTIFDATGLKMVYVPVEIWEQTVEHAKNILPGARSGLIVPGT
jgi:hypothetical protein